MAKSSYAGLLINQLCRLILWPWLSSDRVTIELGDKKNSILSGFEPSLSFVISLQHIEKHPIGLSMESSLFLYI